MKQVLVRTRGLKGEDSLYTLDTPPNTVVAFDSNGTPYAQRNRGLVQEDFRLPPSTSVAVGTSLLFTESGTGTEVIGRATKGGANLKSQASTPADNDNVLLVPVAGSGVIHPINVTSRIIFEARVAINTITYMFAAIGLSELFTDVDPTGTAGEGAMFVFDPTAEFATGVNSAMTGSVLGNWLLAHKVNGADTIADSGIPVVAGRDYVLKIEVDADLKANFYIDGVFVGKGPALTSGDSIGAFAGLELAATPGEQKDVDIRYIEVSRAIG
jgi:hypothetical protein